MNYHNVDMKEALSWGTMKNYYTTQKYLDKFLKERKHKSDIFLNEINYKFIADFEYYLKLISHWIIKRDLAIMAP